MEEEKKSEIISVEDASEKKTNKSRFVGSASKKDNVGNKEDQLGFSAEEKDDLRALVEKNLKWSQIIYEQNRKIKRHLMWSSIGSWIKIIIFVVPFVILAIYLWPLYKSYQFQLMDLLGGNLPISGISSTSTNNNAALKSMLKVIPLTAEQQKQINALLENNTTNQQ